MSFSTQLMKNNYHTHMYLCRHAIGDVEDYVLEAIRLGFDSLGMSDHAPFFELQDRSIRMYPEDLSLYLEKCDACIKKYKNQIIVYKALEIEYFPDHKQKYVDLLKELDYLALGQHYIIEADSPNGLRSSYKLFTKQQITTYVDMVIEAMHSGYFKFVCHPDLFLYNVTRMDSIIMEESRRLIRNARETNTPLEINVNGIRKGSRVTDDGLRFLYPRLEFWQIVKTEKARVIISSDAHQPNYLYDEAVQSAYKFAREIGIEVEEALQI
ncbi:MAG: histidinol-phosphatase [Candidatus Izemoplasmatales bacterium]|nr:histidinol-phosphatase [Candidatus Izemoplasmatales bacterium]NLF49037.1 histidinol-phosphatase [Acholeplasmataceae bacterium]